MRAAKIRKPASLFAALAVWAAGADAQPDAEAVAEAADTETTINGDVVRIGWSRDEVTVQIDGMEFPPSAGLGSWAGFQDVAEGEGDEAMVMGDTVVFQDEVDAAMDAAFDNGLEVTALHNHFFYDAPPVYFMHIGGRGPVTELAAGVKAVWDAIGEVRAQNPEPASSFPGGTPEPGGEIDAETVERLTGLEAGTNDEGVVRVSTARNAEMHGTELGGPMGLTSWAAFSGDDELASIDGDFIMARDEVQPVLQAMREEGFHVVALHNHMVGEAPAYYFTHYWGKGPVEELAASFGAVLEAQAQAR